MKERKGQEGRRLTNKNEGVKRCVRIADVVVAGIGGRLGRRARIAAGIGVAVAAADIDCTLRPGTDRNGYSQT